MNVTHIQILAHSKRTIAFVLAASLIFNNISQVIAITYDAATTEYYDTIDDFGYANGTDSIGLRFGGTLGEYLRFNQTIGRFVLTDDLDVQGTISGSALTIMGNASVSGSLILEGGTSLSGAALRGFGLATDCDDANGSKVLWDATTGRFSCGTDQTGSPWSNTGSLQTYFDNRYVNTSGDTMTGALTIQTSVARTTALNLVGSGSYTIMGASGGSIIHTARGNPTLVGTYDTSGTAKRVVIAGRYAYVADGTTGGLQIVDVTTPSTPTLVGTYDTSGTTNSVAIAGRYAYAADGTDGLQIIDISHPSAPTLVGTYDTTGSAYDIIIAGRYAYIAGNTSGLQIIDISNPSAPTLVGTYNTSGNAYGVTVAGRYAYVADFASGLQIIDISIPTAPTLVGTYNTSGGANNTAIVGRFAYVADGTAGLQIIDVSNPSVPTFVGTYDTNGNSNDITVAGRYAYIADDFSGLQIIDLSIPTAPTLVGTYNTSGTAFNIAIAGRYAYIGDGTNGLQIIDLNGLSTPTASIGALDVGQLDVLGDAKFNKNVTVDRGLNVGDGLYVFGQTSMRAFSGSALYLSTRDKTGKPALTVSGSVVIGTGSTKGAALHVTGTISGMTLYATKSFSGAGLSDCDTGATSKLLWDATTGRFSCGTDQTGGAGGAWSNTGSLQTYFDNRYVNTSGDTMTGALTIQNGTAHSDTLTSLFNVRGTMSGKSLVINGGGYFQGGNGDVNGDGSQTSADLLMLVNYFNGGGTTELLTSDQYARADVNGDSRVDGYDYYMINNYALMTQSENAIAKHLSNTAWTLDLDGDFGIGTRVPDAKLDVIGSISGASLVINGGGEFSGSVGVGRPTSTHSTFTASGSFATRTRVMTATGSINGHDNIIFASGSSMITITLPTAVGITGRQYTIKKTSATTDTNMRRVIVATTSSQTIDRVANWKLLNRGQQVTVVSDGANWQVVDASSYGLNGGFISMGTTMNQWYGAPADATALTTAVLTTTATIRALPFVAQKVMTINGMSVSVQTTAANASVRLALYNDSGRGYPDQLVVDAGAVATTATGQRSICPSGCTTTGSGSLPVTIQPGLYWIALNNNSIAVTLRGYAVANLNPVSGFPSAYTTLRNVGWQVTSNPMGAFPSTFPTAATATTAVPLPAVTMRFQE